MKNEDAEILFIEDSPTDIELTLRSFKQYGVTNKIRVITDGAEALDFIFCRGQHSGRDIKSLPKIVLLDLKLPKVDGFEILRRMKSDDRTKSVPVVILTASKEARDIAESRKLGADSYMVKPIDFESFTAVVQELRLYWIMMTPRR
jgi:CheY-like chemotaxis protein